MGLNAPVPSDDFVSIAFASDRSNHDVVQLRPKFEDLDQVSDVCRSSTASILSRDKATNR
jgi:hypothetical protein